MKKNTITITDVAKVAGVSKSTVSLALQPQSNIKFETKQHVMKVAREMGYVYNRAAANLRRRSSEVIGMVINDLTNPFFAELAVALERQFTDSGYVVMMANTSEDIKQQDKVVRTFCEHGAAGILICPVFGTSQDNLDFIFARNIPIVSVMRPVEGNNCDYIVPDNEVGIFQATQHLLEQGITRLAFLGGLPGTPLFERRLAGFRLALEQAGIDSSSAEVIPCSSTRAAASAAVTQRVEQGNLPQGIVCYSDMVAFGVSFGLDLAGVKIGQDIAITGFDDVEACATVSPPLTSVHIHTDQLATLAAERLIERMRKPDSIVTDKIVTPKLVVRKSSKLSQ